VTTPHVLAPPLREVLPAPGAGPDRRADPNARRPSLRRPTPSPLADRFCSCRRLFRQRPRVNTLPIRGARPLEAVFLPMLRTTPLFRERALRTMFPPPWLCSRGGGAVAARARWRWLARTPSSRRALALLRQCRGRSLQLAGAARSGRPILPRVPTQPNHSKSGAAVTGCRVAQARIGEAPFVLQPVAVSFASVDEIDDTRSRHCF
jgi:hypothetical protein